MPEVPQSSLGIHVNWLARFLGGGFKYFFIFTPKLGEDFQFDEHIFQMGGLKPPTSAMCVTNHGPDIGGHSNMTNIAIGCHPRVSLSIFQEEMGDFPGSYGSLPEGIPIFFCLLKVVFLFSTMAIKPPFGEYFLCALWGIA